ncbi:MAG: cyclic nucleotide-binding domain-containing protein [Bacteroidota bacterium]
MMNGIRSRLFGRGRREKPGKGVQEILKGIPIFDGLTKRELTAVERILHERHYQTDEIIFRQEEPGMGMYIIESGSVGIVSEPGGVQFSELNVGDFFGELALLDEAPRSATAVAKTPCRVFGFFQPDLFSLIERDPRLGVKIVLRLAQIIGSRLRRANDQALSLVEELKQLKQSSGKK